MRIFCKYQVLHSEPVLFTNPLRQWPARRHQLPPQTPAQMRRLRAAWAQAARVDADASMSRGTAMRAARRSAEAEAEEAAEEEDELLLGCI